MIKVITFWSEKNIFDMHIINNMRQSVNGETPPQDQYNRPPPAPLPTQQNASFNYRQQQIPFQLQQQQASLQQQYPPAIPFQRQLPSAPIQYQPPSAPFQQPHLSALFQRPLPSAPFQQQFSQFNLPMARPPPPQSMQPSIPQHTAPPPISCEQQYQAPSRFPIAAPVIPVSSFQPPKQYFELPAGLMMLAKVRTHVYFSI